MIEGPWSTVSRPATPRLPRSHLTGSPISFIRRSPQWVGEERPGRPSLPPPHPLTAEEAIRFGTTAPHIFPGGGVRGSLTREGVCGGV